METEKKQKLKNITINSLILIGKSIKWLIIVSFVLVYLLLKLIYNLTKSR